MLLYYKAFGLGDKTMGQYKQGPLQPEEREDLVIGRGPVSELLKAGRPVECVYVQHNLQGSAVKIAAVAREKGILVKEVSTEKLDSLCNKANHQGVVALTGAAEYCTLEELLCNPGGEPPFLIIADGIEDPHNLGAIIRTAEAAGAHGLIIPKRRSVGLTFGVMKASAGAAEHMRVARVPNLVAAMEQLKKQGVWLYALDMDGENWVSVDYSGPAALVVGSEGKGVSRLVREKCDYVVSLPMRGEIGSLNASVAAGVAMYEVARQRLNIPAVIPKGK